MSRVRIGSGQSSASHALPSGRGRVLGLSFALVVVLSLIAFLLSYSESNTASPHASPSAPDPIQQRQSNPDGVHDNANALMPINPDLLLDYSDHDKTIPETPYLHLLNASHQSSPQTLESHARTDITFAQLLNSPDEYRGQLIQLQGRLRRLLVDELNPNDYGLTVRVEGWVYTNDSGKNPYAVIVCDSPENIPFGGDINHPVTVSGYFLGWWKYSSREGKAHTAPLIVGRRFVSGRVRPKSGTDGAMDSNTLLTSSILGAVLLIGLGGGIWISWNYKSQSSNLDAATGMESLHFEENSPALDEVARKDEQTSSGSD